MLLNNFRLGICIASGLVAAIFGTKAVADEQADFLKLIENPAEQELVINAAKRSAVVLENPCAEAKFTLLNKFATYKPLQFDSAGKVIAGAWKQSVSEKGCGQERLLNVLMYIDEKTKGLKAMSLLPGSTKANALLQKDAIMYAVIAAECPEKNDCKNIYIADTKFLGLTGEALAGAKGKPWDELWTLSMCKKKAEVTMHFIPDSTGTTISTSLKETKFSPTP